MNSKQQIAWEIGQNILQVTKQTRFIMTRARPVGDISLNETLWDIGSLNGNIILNQSIPNVTFNLINFNGQFILFTFEFLQFV